MGDDPRRLGYIWAKLVLKLHDLLEDRGGRFSGDERDDRDPSAGRFDSVTLLLVEGVQDVIAAFDIDVRLGKSEEAGGSAFGEDANGVHALQRRQHRGPVAFGRDRTAG